MRTCLILLLFFTVCVQKPLAQSKTRTDDVADFRHFVKLLEDTHVDPYTPIGGKIPFKMRVQAFQQKIEASDADLSLLLNEFVSYLQDNHTYINTPKKAKSNAKLLPLLLGVVSDGIFIQVIEEKSISLFGAKILSANGISIDSLLQESAKIESGENLSNLKANLCLQLANQPLAQKLIPNLGNFLSLQVVTSKLDTVLQQFSYKERNEFEQIKWHKVPTPLKIDQSGLFSYQFLDTKRNIMYFRLDQMFAQEVVQMIRESQANYGNWITSCLRYYPHLQAMKNKDDAIKRFPYFSEAFRKMLLEMKKHKAEHLIFDLSRNGGGYSSLAIPALYMLFGDQCFSEEGKRKYVRRISQLYLDKYQTSLEKFNEGNATKAELGDYIFAGQNTNTEPNSTKREKYLEELKQKNFGWKKFIDDLNGKAIYSPKITVLTSPATNSAAFHFLADLYRFGNIAVVGVAPKQAGNTPMEGTQFILPNSKLTGSISNSYQIMFPLNDKRAKIFTPDFPLNWSDLKRTKASRTTILEIAIELIETGRIN